MPEPRGKDRLIVALDVPTAKDATSLVAALGSEVGLFKIGWQLFISGEWKELLAALGDKGVFIDLKLPGDIGNTLRSVVEFCAKRKIRFLTLSENVPPPTIRELAEARGGAADPKLLSVLFWSHLGEDDFLRMHGARAGGLDAFLVRRAETVLGAGCDGVIASGSSIGAVRRHLPEALIVSPGIRPGGSPVDDHKRHTTPAEAIRLGADYLVVGRPIRTAPDPRSRARSIADEIDRELDRRSADKKVGN